MVIVESQSEVNEFLQMWETTPSTIIPIWNDLEKHPMNNELSFLFIRLGNTDFILIYNHIDGKSQQIDLSTSTQPKWVLNKKGLLQMDTNIQNLFDISTHTFFEESKLLELKNEEKQFINHYSRMGIRDNLGKIAPLMKWGEHLKSFVDSLTLPTPTPSWMNNDVIPLLSDIERFGVRVDEKKFIDRWPQATKHLKDTTLYTEYNPYTITSRPSNRYGGINFSALNKKDGTRDVFVPKENSIFLQMDYDAYHPRIIGKLIDYELPKTSVHQWLADQYGVPYDESKGITFQLLYGGIPEEFDEIPYYKKVREFIEKLWSKSTEVGYLQTQHRRIPLSSIEGVNPQKLFNYLLQATETELNMGIMKKVVEFIKQTKIELTLYTYDSFLFSYPLDTPKEDAKKLKEIIESFGFPIKADWGTDYGKL
jgi:hypothetical protein|tara:strand:- start:516 stop:1784 length:1269 start_codon:yes stop_codon:yes gene_type:complete